MDKSIIFYSNFPIIHWVFLNHVFNFFNLPYVIIRLRLNLRRLTAVPDTINDTVRYTGCPLDLNPNGYADRVGDVTRVT